MGWEDTQKWANQKIAGLLAVSERMGDKLLVGADPRDKLTTKEQQYELMQQQAHALKAKINGDRLKDGAKNPRLAPNLANGLTKAKKTTQDELFDLFAERLAKKLGELEQKKKPQE